LSLLRLISSKEPPAKWAVGDDPNSQFPAKHRPIQTSPHVDLKPPSKFHASQINKLMRSFDLHVVQDSLTISRGVPGISTQKTSNMVTKREDWEKEMH